MDFRHNKPLYISLIASLFTVPLAPGDALADLAGYEFKPDTSASRSMLKREVVQVFQMASEEGYLRFNISGQPGTHFRIYFSPNSASESYQPVKDGVGVIEDSGTTLHRIDLRALGEDTLHFRVFASDRADFKGDVRTTESVLTYPPIATKDLFSSKDFSEKDVAMGVRGLLPDLPDGELPRNRHY